MGEHTTNLETFLGRKREVRRERELQERWAREDPGAHTLRAFEDFKQSNKWDGWSKREMERMDAEALTYRTRNDEVTRLRKLKSLPDEPWALKSIMPKVPEFMTNDGSTAAENRWELLRKDSIEETVRKAGELNGLVERARGQFRRTESRRKGDEAGD